MIPLHYQSLSDVCGRIKSGELSSTQVTGALLDRISSVDARLKSYVQVLTESALETAARLDEDRASGKPLGLLHGVPVAIKDLLFTRGVATASGTRVMQNFVPDVDATVVTRLKEAGAVIIGKTQLTEGAYGVHHPDVDAPKNPWNEARWPGVSSSGSGVAVAAGLAFAALGSDTGGSIRFPSASCGVVGIKPTYGRVSCYGAFPLAQSLDHIGPMARTVADAARVLQVLAGEDPHDPSSLAEPVPNYAKSLSDHVRGLKIGVDWDYVSVGVDGEVVMAVREALALFADLGATVVEMKLPASHAPLVRDWAITCSVECARAHADYYPEQKSLYGPVLASLIELGLSTGQDEYDALEETRRRFRTEFNEVLQTVDLLIAPCMPSLPMPLEMMSDPSLQPDNQADFLTFTAPYDYSGHPTITLPAGLSTEVLPKAIQLVGPHLGEPALIQAGSAYESALGFVERPVS